MSEATGSEVPLLRRAAGGGGLRAHHRLLQGLAWPFWKWAILRPAGFPLELLDELALPVSAGVADALLAAEEAVDLAHGRAVEGLLARRFHALGAEDRRDLVMAQRRLSARRDLGAAADALARCCPEVHESVAVWRAGIAKAEELRRNLEEGFELELGRARRALHALLSDDRLREAILWLSPAALQAIEAMGEDPPKLRNRQVRKRETTAAMYLQRLCAKNDTVGFFGPRAIASVGEIDGHLACRSSGSEGETREVFLEHWAMVAVAESIASNPAVAGWLRPRRSGRIARGGGLPSGSDADTTCQEPATTSLEAAEERLLALADGTRSVTEIVEASLGGSPPGFSSPGEVEEALAGLERRGLLKSTPVVPTCDLRPDRRLVEELERLLPEERLASALRPLATLERHRSALQACRGRRAAGRALQELEDAFASITGTPPRRAEGQFYAGRSIAYLDCASAVQVDIGREMLQRLKPLELQYATLRELSIRTWHRLLPGLEAAFAGLVAPRCGSVDWSLFLEAGMRADVVAGARAAAEAELRAHWREALSFDDGARRVHRRCSDLAPRLHAVLADRPPAWPGARFCSPDLLIAARDLRAVEAGQYEIVVGEIHAHRNMVCHPVALSLHPEVLREAVAAHAQDVPEVLRPNVPASGMVRAAHFLPPLDASVRMIDADWPPPLIAADRLLPVVDLAVRRLEGELVVGTRDGRWRTSLAVALNSHLCPMHSWRPLAGPHVPRITVDHVVLQRETWEIPGPETARGLPAFLEARRWARSHGLPRHVFVKSPLEAKPFLVDLHDPFLVDELARMSRNADRLRITEMLPGPEQLWLRDAGGRRLTCELRLCAVDPLAVGG